MNETQAIASLKSGCDAVKLLEIVKVLKIPGVLIKKFKYEELRSYKLPCGWGDVAIRARSEQHYFK